jgi:hypothetical protein
VDAFLSLRHQNIDRFLLLRDSLERFSTAVGTVWAAVPDEEFATAGPQVAGPKVNVVSESEALGGAGQFAALRPSSRAQMAKLALASRSSTEFSLDLTPAAICVRPLRFEDLVSGGKAYYCRYVGAVHAECYEAAERLLGLSRSGWVHGIAPYLLHRVPAGQLLAFLGARLAGRDSSFPHPAPLEHLAWLLGPVYFTFLEAFDLEDDYHSPADSPLAGNCAWGPAEWAAWDPAASFGGQEDFFFSVVCSSPGVPAAAVRERVAPFLGGEDP